MIHDLLYFGEDRHLCQEAKSAFKSDMPDAQYEIDCDDVHGYRLVVSSASISRFKYLQLLYRTGFLLTSFHFGIMQIQTPRRMLAFCRGMKSVAGSTT